MVRLWELRMRKQRAALKGHAGCVFGLAVAGKLLASASQDGTVCLWDSSSGNRQVLLKQASFFRSLALTLYGKMLATGDGDNGGQVRFCPLPKLPAPKGT